MYISVEANDISEEQQDGLPMISPQSDIDHPRAKKPRIIAFRDVTVSVEGSQHLIRDVPSTHEVLIGWKISKYNKYEMQVKCVRDKFGPTFTGGMLSKMYICMALAYCPVVGLSAAAVIIPLLAFSLLEDTGILTGLDAKMICSSFPCHETLRGMMLQYSAECLPFIYLSCNKGNKKGLSHFVKVLSW